MPSPTAKRALFQTPTKSGRQSKKIKLSQLPKQLIPELKHRDVASGVVSSIVPLRRLQLDLSSITQGDRRDQRNGTKIFVKNLDLSFAFSQFVTTGTDCIRLSVLRSKGIATTDIQNPLLKESHEEFHILHDEVIPLDKAMCVGRRTVTINQPVVWQYNTANILDNSIIVKVVASNPTNAFTGNEVAMRVYFTDV